VVVAVVGSVLFSGGGVGNLGSISSHAHTHTNKLPNWCGLRQTPLRPSQTAVKSDQISASFFPSPPRPEEEGEDEMMMQGQEEEMVMALTDLLDGEEEREGGIRKSRERYLSHFLDLLLC
jgi:hypothetical protein